MTIKRLLIFLEKDSIMGSVKTWVGDKMAQSRFNVTVLRDTPLSGKTTVVVDCSPGFYREYINIKRSIVDGKQ